LIGQIILPTVTFSLFAGLTTAQRPSPKLQPNSAGARSQVVSIRRKLREKFEESETQLCRALEFAVTYREGAQ
jgi:hypothetical protein